MTNTATRVAGWACLLSAASAAFGTYGIYARLVVSGDTAETARNIMAHQRLFRLLIACDLIYATGVVVLLTALYVILKPVHPGLALLAACFRLVYAAMWVVMALNCLAVLRLLGGADYLQVFEADRLQALARFYLGANFNAYYVGLPFYGLASTVCSILWFKSNTIPRGLAAFGVISSAWCAACGFVFIVFPGFGQAINLYAFDSPMGLFEIATSLWLLLKGVRTPEG